MIALPCPHCSRPLEFADEMAGASTLCYACRQELVVPTESTELPPADVSDAMLERLRDRQVYAGRPPGVPLHLIVVLGLFVVFGMWLLWRVGQSAVAIHVDNGGDETVVVFLDEQQQAEVRPHSQAIVLSPPGARRVQVRRGGQLVFDEVKDLERAGATGQGKYLLNVEKRNRYAVFAIEYGASTLPAGGALDEQFRTLRGLFEALPAADWRDVNDIDYLFEDPPLEIAGGLGASTSRRVLKPITPLDALVLEGARRIERPTPDDMQALAQVVRRVYPEKQLADFEKKFESLSQPAP